MYVIRRSLIFGSIVSCQIVFSNIFVAFQQMNWLKSNALSWEQRKLGDIAKFINGRAYDQNELLPSGKYKVLRVGNFYTNDSWYYSDLVTSV